MILSGGHHNILCRVGIDPGIHDTPNEHGGVDLYFRLPDNRCMSCGEVVIDEGYMPFKLPQHASTFNLLVCSYKCGSRMMNDSRDRDNMLFWLAFIAVDHMANWLLAEKDSDG